MNSEYYIVKKETMTNIADNVRALTGSNEGLTPTSLSNEIQVAKENIDDTMDTLEAAGIDVPEGAGIGDLAALVGSAGSSSGGIIDVIELPVENIKENCFYRLLTAKFLSNQYSTTDGWTCYCVNELPDVGEVASTDMINITAYYNVSDNGVYGYVDNTLGAAGGIPAGWYPIATLGQAFNVSWGGVITDIEDMTNEGVWLLLSYDFYLYKNGWSLVPFAYEKQPAFDITWDGDMTGRSALDMSMLGYNQGVYFVKVSDIIPTVDEVVGGNYRGVWYNGDRINDDFIYDTDLNTTTYPGAFIIGDFITVLHDADTLSTALGIPTGMYTNGVYFWIYTDAADGGHITRFTAPTKIIKIDEKFLPDMSVDVSSLGLHSVATTGNYNSLNNKPTIYTDVIRYSVSNQSLSSTYKSNVRNNIDVYSRSEVDTKIASSGGSTDLSAYALKADIPTKVSAFTNDANYAKTTDVETMIAEAIGTAIGGSY